MGRTRKSQHTSLGKSLVKKNRPGWEVKNITDRHTVEDQTTILKSVTEETSYEEFLATAVLADRDFTAEKLNVKFVSLSTADPLDTQDNYMTEAEKKLVVVPRRPTWTTQMTAEELDDAEKEAFLSWRRHMSQLQDKNGITPFERNLEVWRQLWRVVERSHVTVQIVDGRNPLLYRCEDLEKYVKELGKRNILLVNKADFLTESQRKQWSAYFDSVQLPHLFYSAALAVETVKPIQEDDENVSDSESSEDGGEEEDGEDNDDEETPNKEEKLDETKTKQTECAKTPLEKCAILSRDQLVEFLKTFKPKHVDLFTVGLVGYPNVGKSSTINSLMAHKKTSVSSTPGKTKHFQTLFLEEDLMLCDCPGLVMPSYGGSRGEMVLGGILPVDQLTEFVQPTVLLAERIPRSILEYKYGVTLPKEFNNEDLLNAYASIRGFMTVRGLPDCSRAARIILKDYVNGKLNYCHAPPNISQELFQPSDFVGFSSSTVVKGNGIKRIDVLHQEDDPTHTNLKPTTIKQPNLEKKLDNQFFAPVSSTAHIKGRQHIKSGLTSASSSSTELGEKPWKKHNNKKKREKLRITFRHLDVD